MSLILQDVPYEPSKVYEKPLIEITQSSLGCFQSCEQKFVLRYRMQLASRGISIPLIVGTAVHKGLEILLMPINRSKDTLQVLQESLKAVDSIFDKAEESDAALVGSMSEKLNKGRAQAHACVMAWHFHYYDAIERDFHVVETESTFRAKEGATTSSPLLDRMAGKLDAHVTDSGGMHALMEHKTKGSLTAFNWIDGLALDRQLMWYIYKARSAWGLPIEMVYYNVIGKPAHRAGATWDALKQKMVEAMYGDPEKYFTMPPILIDERDLDRQYSNWIRVIERMDNLSPANVTLNTSACSEWGGCPYKALCQRRADVADPQAVLDMPETDLFCFKPVHEELEEEAA